MRIIKTRRIPLPLPCDALPVLLEARAQCARGRVFRRVARRHGHIDARQRVLIEAKRFSRQTLQVIARDGRAARARSDREPQARVSVRIRQHGQTKVRVRHSLALLPYCEKFGRLVQTLARLERQFG